MCSYYPIKNFNINVPKLDDFIHKVYINIARKVYKNVYLFEINIPPLNIQKNYRELEIIVQECILNTLRESIPVEAILKAYMDETVEEDVVEEIKEQIIEEKAKPIVQTQPVQNQHLQTEQINKNNVNRLSFNDVDYISGGDGNIVPVTVPKTIENLENISNMRSEQRKMDDSDEDEEDNIKLKISNEPISLDEFDVHVIEEPKLELFPDLLIDAEVLD